MRLYLIAGRADVGKNKFGDFLKKEFQKCEENVCLLRITAPLYHYAEEQFGLPITEENKPRSFLQKMGIEVIKEKMGLKFFLIDRLTEDIKILDDFFDIGIITDGRLIEEFNELKKRFPDIKIINIKRDNYETNLNEEEKTHITERDLDNDYNYDYVIVNDELEELENDAKRIVSIEEERDE